MIPAFTATLGTKKISDFKPSGYGVGLLAYNQNSKKLTFYDGDGKYHPLNKLMFLSPEWNDENGEKRLPEPFIIDDQENVISEGDRLLFVILDTNTFAILGSMFQIEDKNYDSSTNTDTTDLDSIRARALVRNNKTRYYNVQDDAKGNVSILLEGKDGETPAGNFAIKVKGNKTGGKVLLEANGQIAINQTQTDGDTETVIAQLFFDNTKDAEKIQIVDKNKNKISLTKDGINIESSKDININVKGNTKLTSEGNATISAKEVTITGGKLITKGKCTPKPGQGAFSAVPGGNCIFSGAPITGDTIEGT